MDRREIKKWKVLRSDYLYREPWFTVRREKVELPNGSVIPSYYVLEYPEWVCVLGVTKEGKMIIERQYRHGIGEVGYEICAGVVDPTDASCLDAARRELQEETGYGKGNWELFMTLSANPGTHTNRSWCFLATDLEKISDSCQEVTEDIEVELMEPEEVRELLVAGKVVQAMHAAALWKYFCIQK